MLRLWVASCDYREELRVSKEILARIVEAYRKLRNTTRYLVANLYDFNPATDMVPVAQMEEVDRFILARYAQLGLKVLESYESYDYPTIFQALNAFMTVDLSALYNDISKDRLYTFAARSKERRSAQTAMHVMAEGLARLIAPILSVTAEQLWQYSRAHAAIRSTSSSSADGSADVARRHGSPRALGASEQPERTRARPD